MKEFLKNVHLTAKKVKSHHVAISAISLVIGIFLGMGLVKTFTSAAGSAAGTLSTTTTSTGSLTGTSSLSTTGTTTWTMGTSPINLLGCSLKVTPNMWPHPLTVTLTGLGTGGIMHFIKWGDGTTTTGSWAASVPFTLTHTYTGANPYVITGMIYPVPSVYRTCNAYVKVF